MNLRECICIRLRWQHELWDVAKSARPRKSTGAPIFSESAERKRPHPHADIERSIADVSLVIVLISAHQQRSWSAYETAEWQKSIWSTLLFQGWTPYRWRFSWEISMYFKSGFCRRFSYLVPPWRRLRFLEHSITFLREGPFWTLPWALKIIINLPLGGKIWIKR